MGENKTAEQNKQYNPPPPPPLPKQQQTNPKQQLN